MKKAIKISIPEPCHEDWSKMTPTEKGKHCAVCTKEVVDFTNKSDEAIFKYVSKNDNACGRFKSTQLDRTIKLQRKERNSFIPWAASFLLPFTMLQPGAVKAELDTTVEKNYTSLGIGRYSNTKTERAQIVTKGTVVDSNGNPVKNVEITASETDTTVWTDKEGRFEFNSLDHEILTFQKEGYTIQTNKRGSASEKIVVSLIAEIMPHIQIMGGIRSIEKIIKAEPVSETTTKGKIAEAVEEIITGDVIEVVEVTVTETVIKENEDEKAVTISGIVTDESGIPLAGANVIIVGTSTGTQTDFDGNYSIEADPGQKLAFSYLGFQDKVITVSTISNTMNINMELAEMVSGGIIVCVIGEYEEPVRTTEEKKALIKERREAEANLNKFYKKQREEKKAARRARRDKK